ncbi:XRE family transcriptional regulator [Lentzea sp. BCCO 10_0856]|uniref:XRE family transcriptional regulator n=1 Tax=Lentzea miocenica TaxID=3095431 RepID=A0ABU4TIE7_9PSEU|nr:XRE family transcriptional regulator [Lentzea sp. BCCO 10_0856]MDX8037632.1 XRE family transcriptional regulator [Lentzea sp. BCCO 10_0856]
MVNAWIYANTSLKRVGKLDARYIGKLERGDVRWPGQYYRDGLRAVLRVNADADLGFRPPDRSSPRGELVLPAGLPHGAGVVPFGGRSASSYLAQVAPTEVPSVIGPEDIAGVRTAADLFRNWDAEYGGNFARVSVVAQLQYAAQLHDVKCPPNLKRALYSAVGRLGQAAAFMAFDAQANDDALRMFCFALAQAEEGADWHLRANILSSMARQSFWMNDPDRGLTYIELAMVRSDRLSHTERAMLAAVRARALAQLGRVEEAVAAVGQADEEFSLSNPADSMYAAYYDAAEHAGETGHALSDLALRGKFISAATDRLRFAIESHGDEYARARAFCQIRLASQLMVTGDPREAAALGGSATSAAAKIRSNRVIKNLRELQQFAAGHHAIPEAAELHRKIGAVVST